MRYTKSDVQGMFNRLAKAMNKRVDGGSGLGLDYIACYGGYVVVQYDELGGESHPFGCMRRSATEMYLSMCMTVQALEALNQEEWQLKHAKFLAGGSL